MSLIPLIFDDICSLRPSRFMDQHFGLGVDPEDLLCPISAPRGSVYIIRRPETYSRPWQSVTSKKDRGSTVETGKGKFEARLDVQQFAPEEITVKVTGENIITVEGKHDEKQDQHGFISRHFVRRYVLPKDHDMDKVQSTLSSDGVLTITAPLIDAKQVEHRNIPITKTGAPSKPTEETKEQEEK